MTEVSHPSLLPVLAISSGFFSQELPENETVRKEFKAGLKRLQQKISAAPHAREASVRGRKLSAGEAERSVPDFDKRYQKRLMRAKRASAAASFPQEKPSAAVSGISNLI